jgi:DNA-binding MarR family transcriptional regulator
MNHWQSPLKSIPGFNAWVMAARACQLCQRTVAAAIESLDLELAHYDVLANVLHEPGISQQVLARRLLVAKSNVSVLLSSLERRGLVRREGDKADGRVRRVFLTAEGDRLARIATERHAEILAGMLAPLSDADINSMQLAMGRIVSVLDPRPNKP